MNMKSEGWWVVPIAILASLLVAGFVKIILSFL